MTLESADLFTALDELVDEHSLSILRIFQVFSELLYLKQYISAARSGLWWPKDCIPRPHVYQLWFSLRWQVVSVPRLEPGKVALRALSTESRTRSVVLEVRIVVRLPLIVHEHWDNRWVESHKALKDTHTPSNISSRDRWALNVEYEWWICAGLGGIRTLEDRPSNSSSAFDVEAPGPPPMESMRNKGCPNKPNTHV